MLHQIAIGTQSSCSMFGSIFFDSRPIEDIREDIPKGVDESHWIQLVGQWFNDDNQKRATMNSSNAKKQKCPHTMGRMSIARRERQLEMTCRLLAEKGLSPEDCNNNENERVGTLNQLLYFIGLKHTTPTIACALTNILPAITFIMAVPFRIETAEVRTPAGKAKIAGTALCVGGSMLMTFYKGSLIRIPPSSIHWRYAEVAGSAEGAPTSTGAGGEAVGAMLVVGSCAAWAAWFVMQAKMSKSFSMPYTSSALMCAMSGGECMVVGVAVERDPARWALGLDIRLASVLYIGVVGSAFAVCAMSWAIEKRGPLYVSMFSPLLLVVVAVLGWAFLDEQLYVGSAIGSLIIVVGLYMVLWGNGREFNMNSANNVNEKDVDQKGGAKTDREVDDDNGDQNHELIKVKFEEVL
ncbi:WAT1-related protein [Apostasia shenzhenica]|uniref:WAT1-related protein n=1 Tax=Apostasia shenzhenica TaxID=1088818 RepID=A0A2I0AML4_9ASPA|nr:WAT1-related protein [Apostasia shenzhenica]